MAAKKSVTSLLAGFFNVGEAKRSLSQFSAELKALSPQEKNELALGVADIIGHPRVDVNLLPVE